MLMLKPFAIRTNALFALVWIAVVVGMPADAATTPRIALVIGNGAYETSPACQPGQRRPADRPDPAPTRF